MSNIIRFTPPRRAREEVRLEASRWLARVDAGLCAGDQEKLGRWLREDPLHEEMLLEMAAFWDRLSVLSELSDVFPLQLYHSRKRVARRRLILAAGLAAALPLGTLLFNQRRRAGSRGLFAGRYETSVGERDPIRLSDGSQIILNTNTLLDVAYSPDERRVVLRHGEALFSVAHDPGKPFRVYAGARVIEAIGTAFSVQRREDESLEVLVTEGRVNVRSGAGASPAPPVPNSVELSLRAGEYLHTQSGERSPAKAVMERAEMEQRLSWRSGLLVFRGDRLEQVLAEASRYTTIRLEADAAILSRRVAAVVPTGDIESLLSQLELNLNVRAERLSEDHILLTAQ